LFLRHMERQGGLASARGAYEGVEHLGDHFFQIVAHQRLAACVLFLGKEAIET
jgi:hypothetical protein